MDPLNKLEGSKAIAQVIVHQAQELTAMQRDCPAFCLGVANILQTIEQLMHYRGNSDLAQQLQPIYRAILAQVEGQTSEPHEPHEPAEIASLASLGSPSIWNQGEVVPSVEEFRRISAKLVEHGPAKMKGVDLTRDDFRRLAGIGRR